MTACAPKNPFKEYPDSGHSHLRLYETRRVLITSQEYRDACKLSKAKNYGYRPKGVGKGKGYPTIKNKDDVEYYIKKRRTNREGNQDLPEYQYIASRAPIHLPEDIQNWDPDAESFPNGEPEPKIGLNVFDTTLGSIYCGSSRVEKLMIIALNNQGLCGIGELLVEACLNDDEHVLSVALNDDEIFGAEGSVKGVQGGVRDYKRQKCQDFVEVFLRDEVQKRIGTIHKARQYWPIMYLRGALRSKYEQLITLQKSCFPAHSCGPNDRKCIDDSRWRIYETQGVINEYEGYEQGYELNEWVDMSTRIINDRWYFCRFDLNLAP